MQSKKINELGTNVSPSINDLTVVGDAATGQLKKITLNQIASLFGSVGGVSSVAMTVPTGLTVTGSPITTSGTFAVTLSAGYSIPTTAKQSEWDTGYAERLKWDGGASGLSAPTARTSLGLVIGTDVLGYRTFGSAANNNTGDFATAAQGVSADTAYTNRITGASLPLSISGNVISIAEASTTISGFLSSTNFNTFNGKQAALNGTGFVKATGTTISYDNTSYLPLSGGTLTGTLNGTSASFSNRLTVGGGTTNGILVSGNGGSITLPTTGLSFNTGFDVGYISNYTAAGASADLYYDASKHLFSGILGIGTTTPQTALDIISNTTYQLRVATGTGSYSSGSIYFGGLSTGDPYYYGTIGWNQGDVTMRIGAQCGNGTGGIAFYTSGNTAAQTEKMRITSNGNVLINSSVDNGQGKLQVSGNIYVSGIAAAGNLYSVSSTLSTAYYHVFNGSSGQTLTLPSPLSNNVQYVIINNSANTLTLAAATSTNIITTTGTSVASITLIANQRVFVLADGNNKYYQIF